jgi:predicted Rossmann fold nucleotide-binding protein DprA/Smf involved in DNA uptake
MTDAPLACLQLIHSTARSGKIRDALMHYRDPVAAWDALSQLDRSLKPGLKHKQALLDRGRTWLETRGNHVIAWHEPDYPPPLRQTASPPPFLFVRGRRDLLWHPQIAIVAPANQAPPVPNAPIISPALWPHRATPSPADWPLASMPPPMRAHC